jgi:hypothetical protein
MTEIPAVPLTRHLGGFWLHGQRWDKSASDAASTRVSGLRQPGGNLATFNQDVPGRADIAIMGGPTLRAGPRPDIQG